MVKIVNILKGAGLYGALIFALYGNNPILGGGRDTSRYALAPSRSRERGAVKLGAYAKGGSLTRSTSMGGGEAVYVQGPFSEAVSATGGYPAQLSPGWAGSIRGGDPNCCDTSNNRRLVIYLVIPR